MEKKTFFKGDWIAIEKIGEGSFGTVYKAQKKDNYGIESYSAIKQILIPQSEKEYSILKSEGMTESDIEKSYDNEAKKWIEEIRFLNEFKDNENIVSIEDYEVIERKDRPGRIINIKMELLQNIDDHVLDKVITDKKVLKMAIDVLNALEECEEKNVVHRDIKPDNVFVNSRGVYKLGDFGEAKSIEKTVSNMSKKGTENYMAPEIYKGERGSKSVDTYSLGIMLYKYFNNNRLPFLPEYPREIQYEDRENAIYKRMSGEKMPVPVKATYNMAKIILKACSYKPEDRYTSAMEMKKEIEKEYREIQTPLKLFDFQEKESQKIDGEDSYEGTVGIFSNNSSQKNSNDTHNGTVGIFSNSSSQRNSNDSHNGTIGIFSNDQNKVDSEEKDNEIREDFSGIPKKENITPKECKTDKTEDKNLIKKILDNQNNILEAVNIVMQEKKLSQPDARKYVDIILKENEIEPLSNISENGNNEFEMHEIKEYQYKVPKGYLHYKYNNKCGNYYEEKAIYRYSNFSLELAAVNFFTNIGFEKWFEKNMGMEAYSNSVIDTINPKIKFKKIAKQEKNNIKEYKEYIFWFKETFMIRYIIKYTVYGENNENIYKILSSFVYNEKWVYENKKREQREKGFEK